MVWTLPCIWLFKITWWMDLHTDRFTQLCHDWPVTQHRRYLPTMSVYQFHHFDSKIPISHLRWQCREDNNCFIKIILSYLLFWLTATAWTIFRSRNCSTVTGRLPAIEVVLPMSTPPLSASFINCSCMALCSSSLCNTCCCSSRARLEYGTARGLFWSSRTTAAMEPGTLRVAIGVRSLSLSKSSSEGLPERKRIQISLKFFINAWTSHRQPYTCTLMFCFEFPI